MRASNLVRLVFAIAAVVFLIAPLIAILPLAFTSSVFLTYPIPGYSMRWFDELASADVWRMSIVNSLIIGTGTTLLAGTLGTLAALGLRNAGLVLPGLFRTAFLLPMVVPAVVLGVGMQVFFVHLGLANSYAGVIAAHSVVAVPFVVVSVTASLAGIDRRVERAAASLGAGPLTVFRRVTLPLALPGILSGAVFAFATSLDEVVLTLFVAGPNQRTLARQMFSSIRENISPAIAAAAFLFIIGTLLIAAVAVLVRRRTERLKQPAEA
ncbi:ABC transporter permease [Aquamicrobium sp. NLF2-7]|jgi:putative spermidine/putrescine transport system permease protein|uniref:Putative spermidine/putrescine transport system permease protein n=1 Tax=Aquamicrobium lusatiense TaxID=89772 RepID=A0A7W9VUH1_9HYPH|nr:MULTISPECIES: ABC transporter permease [Aquamicrobium]MBB6010997.1 putative spermidine/putrescine transport system permease protein [Aquamicrobium lusatiense]MCG8271787.1 ABC transporter permease [Aquamicrobium sp. NLF2-7]